MTRHPSGKAEDKTTDCINLVTLVIIKEWPGDRFQNIDFQPRIRNRCTITFAIKTRRGDGIMLILNFADNFLDQVFDGNQSIDPAKFINNQRQMPPSQTHFI